MKKENLIVLVSFLALFQACQNSSSPGEEIISDIAYHTSFETPKDTIGWESMTKNISNEHPPEGGNFSLHIGGGCPQPAAVYMLSKVAKGNYKLSFWAKMGQENQACSVFLKKEPDSSEKNKLEILINSSEWNYYETNTALYVPQNKKLTLEVWVGGIIYEETYIDDLKIEKVFY